MRNKLVVVLFFLVLVLGVKFASSFVYDYMCRNSIDEELQAKVNNAVLTANVKVVNKTLGDSNGKEVIVTYNPGGSGVIFKRQGRKYYILTAAHVVVDYATSELIAIPYGNESYTDATKNGKNKIELYDYYEKFPKLEMEYIDEAYDLAVLSFSSEDALGVLNMSNAPAGYKEKVMSIGNDVDNDKFYLSYGKVTTKEPVDFGEGAENTSHKVIRHSAYVKPGSSGSVLLNKDMEIVGINLGGATDILGNFRYGMAMPVDKVQQFLDEWR